MRNQHSFTCKGNLLLCIHLKAFNYFLLIHFLLIYLFVYLFFAFFFCGCIYCCCLLTIQVAYAEYPSTIPRRLCLLFKDIPLGLSHDIGSWSEGTSSMSLIIFCHPNNPSNSNHCWCHVPSPWPARTEGRENCLVILHRYNVKYLERTWQQIISHFTVSKDTWTIRL
jgi:hypothetical protein